ncbi:MAG TPA: hypothetical protein VMA73_28060 [Streptosporangiaceae bacterium]|nr:hypothetical protein [Streptosporangiaceae bacterium]
MRINRIVAAATGLALATGGVLASAVGTASAQPVSVAGHAAVRTGPPGGPVPRGFRVASVTFVSASDGWVLGTTKTCAHKPCTSVLRTTDGGRSWTGIPAPKYKLARYNLAAGLVRLRFADALDGFAYGSQLWVTHNGGSSWHRVRQVPGYVTDLETSAGVAYAVTSVNKSGKEVVYSSPAGRDSWHRVAGLPETAGPGGLGSITLHGKAAWLILGGKLYSTHNGSHWTKESFTCPAGYGITSVAAYSASQITLLCVGNPGLGSSSKLLYASTNGGAHFARVGVPPRGGDGGLLAEPTPQHLFIATASGATWLYASTDGGKRWHQALTLDDAGLGWNDFGFTTPSQGVAVEGMAPLGLTRLWLTRNAGRTWHAVKF